MEWLNLVWTLVSAVVGGFIGGWTVAYRAGKWRQSIDDRVRANEERLQRGDPHVGQVPILTVQIKLILDELRDLKQVLRGELKELVSREECERRHEHHA